MDRRKIIIRQVIKYSIFVLSVFVLYVMDDLFQGNHLPNSYLSVYRIIERRQKQEPTQRESLLRRLNVKDL